jgi:hypothetical protein
VLRGDSDLTVEELGSGYLVLVTGRGATGRVLDTGGTMLDRFGTGWELGGGVWGDVGSSDIGPARRLRGTIGWTGAGAGPVVGSSKLRVS